MKSFLSVLPLAGLAIAHKCSQEYVTATVIEKVTVTVPAISSEPTPYSAAEPTATTVVTSVVYVTPSPAPYYPLPNGTHPRPHPTTFRTVSYVLPSFVLDTSSAENSDAATAAPVETSDPVETSYSAPIATSEAPAPTSKKEEAAVPTSEAPAASEPTTSPDVSAAATNSGEATFYGGNVAGGMCSFTGYTIPSGIYGTALSDSNWAGAGNCGACISVKGPNGNSVKAMVVDQCPGCGTNHLDLFPNAFAALASPSKGIIPVSWSIVPCGITSPIVLKNKEGTSKYWFSMQVMNSNVPVSKLEVSTDGGKTWKATTRQPYNFFENSSGFGTDSVDVKVTSVNGGTVTVKGVSIAAGSTKTAGGNFA